MSEEKKDFLYDIYMLCPVRGVSPEEKDFLEEYENILESRGKKVLYPGGDTVQEDPTGGYRICKDHCTEIYGSKSAHMYWNPSSKGSYVDFGTIMGEHFKRGMFVSLINRRDVESIVEEQRRQTLKDKGPNAINKTYEEVMLVLDKISSKDPSRMDSKTLEYLFEKHFGKGT